MGTYTFKSSGRTTDQVTVETLVKSTMPIGIKTPMAMGGASEGILAMNMNVEDQMHDNLRNLLLTNWGERLGQYKLGANLRSVTSEVVSQDDFDTAALQLIRDAVSQWMPFIELENYHSDIDHNDNRYTGVINITITYSIPTLKVQSKALQVTLYVM